MLDVSSKISWHLSQRGNKNNHCGFDLERFSTECRKTKVITQPIRRKEISYESQSEFKVKTTKLPKARENAGDQVAAGFSFACDWFREWREYSGPIREQSKMQSQITFDNLKMLTIPMSWNELKCEKSSEGFLITRKRASPSSYTDIRFSNSFFLFRSFTLVMSDGNCSISSLIPIFKTFNSSCSTRS